MTNHETYVNEGMKQYYISKGYTEAEATEKATFKTFKLGE